VQIGEHVYWLTDETPGVVRFPKTGGSPERIATLASNSDMVIWQAGQKALQKKQWELYKQNKVNPMGSCLPALVQWPVFIGFFTMIRTAIELRPGFSASVTSKRNVA